MADSWVELRVHGVSGTPPENILDIDRVQQVAGDEFGRFFRRADRRGAVLEEPDGHVVEAYHWGQFTSGSWTKGLWLLLAPFGLVNAAQFMLERPTSRGSTAAHAVAGAMLRLLGLALTLLFVLAAAIFTMDLWAWQRAGETGGGFPTVLAMFGPVALLVVYMALARSEPALNQEVLALPRPLPAPSPPAPSSVSPFSSPPPPVEPPSSPASPPPPGLPGPDRPKPEDGRHPSDLVRPGFFEGRPDAPALQFLHLAGGLVLVAVLGFAPGAIRGTPGGDVGFWLASGVLGLVSVLVVVLGDPEQSASTSWQDPPPGSLVHTLHTAARPIGMVMAGAGAAVFVAAAVYVGGFGPPPRPTPALHYPGVDWAAYVVLLVAVGALLVLAVANGLLAHSRRRSTGRAMKAFAPYAGGMGCTLIAAIGVFLGVGYVGAFGTALAAGFSTATLTVKVPELLSRIVYAWGVTAVAILLLAVLAASDLRRRRGDLGERAREDFTTPRDGLHVPPRWVPRIATSMWAARTKNSVAPVLATLAILGGVLSAFVGYEMAPQLSAPLSWPALSGRDPQAAAGWLSWISQSETWPVGNRPVRAVLMTLGTLTLTGLATALIFLGRTALLGGSARRGVNVVWDVVSFWPRSTHPFVPAAYSQRAVPDLEARIRWHLKRAEPGPGRRLVLCGHSQGSLLSFATLLRLAASPRPEDDGLIGEVGLVTFGSQLQVMFSRGFPAYVNHTAITRLHQQLGGAWRNLYRGTDQLAGPVLSWDHRRCPDWIGRPDGQQPAAAPPPLAPPGRQQFGPDWRLLDPPIPADPDLDENALLGLRRHGEYWLDQAWPAALQVVRSVERAAPGPPTRDRM